MNSIPIRRSLHRHNLVFGAERNLIMFSALIAMLVGIGGLTLLSILTAAGFWVCSVIILRLMAKADPIMFQVWLRHIKQQDFYSARSSRWRVQGGFKC